MPTIKDSSSIEEVLQYIVACYGAEIYQEKQRLSNLIADLYTGEERLKRLYRRMVMEDTVSQQLHAISLKPIQEREGFYNRLVFQFKEANFYEEAFARQVLDVFLHGMNLLLVEPISTKATEEDGEWYDEYGVKYSADRKKLISVPSYYQCSYYSVLDGTVIICDKALSYCENLREITLPSSVTSIGERAFQCCDNLCKIILPLNITIIGKEAFYCCSGLHEIKVAENHRGYRTIDGVLYTKDLKMIVCYPAGKKNKNFVIPSGVMSIGEVAFFACRSLETIIFPSSVTNIEKAAFFNCMNLCEITLPPDVTNIGDKAFSNCRNLREITIPSSVTCIGERAFWRCENLQQINIPAGTLEKFKKLLPDEAHLLHEV
ncbi:MAG TPA: leucine-rich repeat domain-containing protein [Candidatus Parabacteroides faecavium]|nr:leucine-rich repeat domain-containing protein [Candidatus Parabacteroides faecavium]